MGYREEIREAITTGVKYCFTPLNGKYPLPDVSETEEFVDFISSLVFKFRKESFFSGYAAGVCDAASDLGGEFNNDLSRFGAERAFNLYDKDK